jgi:hypothetical protein
MNILTKSFFIGLIGDLILQIMVKLRGNFGGLRDYFKLHGIFESMMIGAGIMFVLIFIYTELKLPMKFVPMFIFGGVADIIWRQFNLMPTLKDTYYKRLNPFQTFFWGGFSNVLPLYF